MDELVVRMRLEAVEGIHVTVGVFAGPDEDHLGKCGALVFRIEEWEALRQGKATFQVKRLEEIPKSGWQIMGCEHQYELVGYQNLAVTIRSLEEER